LGLDIKINLIAIWNYTGWQQFVTLLFAQIAGHDSLRAIQTSLGVHSNKWYHLGLEDIKRSTLSDAMKNRLNLLYFRGCDVKSRIYELFFAEPVAPSTAPTGTCRMSNRPV